MFKKKQFLKEKEKKSETFEYKTHLKFVFPNVSLIKSILMFRPIIRTTAGQIATHAMTRGYKHLKVHYSFCSAYEAPTHMDLCWCTVNYKRKHKQTMWKTGMASIRYGPQQTPSLRQVLKR